MTAFVHYDLARKLEQLLLDRLPNLNPWLAAARQEEGALQSEYAVFAYAVRPYLMSLLALNCETELREAWRVLDNIAIDAEASTKNELLVVTTEELPLWRFYRFMGPVLRERWLASLTWFPAWRDRIERMNTHIDRSQYVARWLEEIERIGGFEALTEDREAEIAVNLAGEFRIEPWKPPV